MLLANPGSCKWNVVPSRWGKLGFMLLLAHATGRGIPQCTCGITSEGRRLSENDAMHACCREASTICPRTCRMVLEISYRACWWLIL